MKNLTYLFFAISLAACDQSSAPDKAEVAAKNAPTFTKSPAQMITGEQRSRIVTPLIKGLEVERDKIERVTFYLSKGLPRLTPSLDAYIALPDEKMPALRMRAIYSGKRWVFYTQIKIMADDVIVYDRPFKAREIQHNNSGGQVWETADFFATPTELAALTAVANSKSATIRFSGRDKRQDHEVKPRERADLQRMLATYEAMKAQLEVPAT